MNPTQHHATAEQRRQQIASLYLQGQYQSQIAQQLGVTQQQISYDLKALQKAWLASALRDFDAAKAQELAKIDECERAYWAGWERSCQEREVTTTKRVRGDVPRTESSRRRETPAGDVRFLDGVMRCIHQRCDILGLSTQAAATQALSTGLAALLTQAKATVAAPALLAEA
jgi:transposase-like protein